MHPCSSRAGVDSTDLTKTPAPWTCTYPRYGCTVPAADNYMSYATVATNGMCEYGGCTRRRTRAHDTGRARALAGRPSGREAGALICGFS